MTVNIGGRAVAPDPVFRVPNLLFDFVFDQLEHPLPIFLGEVKVVFERNNRQ